jgi:hypothetical protein
VDNVLTSCPEAVVALWVTRFVKSCGLENQHVTAFRWLCAKNKVTNFHGIFHRGIHRRSSLRLWIT